MTVHDSRREETVDLYPASAYGNFCILKGLDMPNMNMINSNNETLLHLAAENGHLQIVEYLLERGAQSNIRNSKG